MRVDPPLDGVTAVTLVVAAAAGEATSGGSEIPRPGPGPRPHAEESFGSPEQEEAAGRGDGEMRGGGVSAWEMLLWGLGPGEAGAGQLPSFESAGGPGGPRKNEGSG